MQRLRLFLIVVEIAVVVVGDFRRDIALGDAIDVIGGHVQGADDGVERVVDALNDFAEIALMLVGIGAGGELSVHSRLGQHRGVGH